MDDAPVPSSIVHCLLARGMNLWPLLVYPNKHIFTARSPAMKIRLILILGITVLGLAALGVGVQAHRAAAPLPEGSEPLPPGVTVQTMLQFMRKPVAFAFDPQGRIFYTEKDT